MATRDTTQQSPPALAYTRRRAGSRSGIGVAGRGGGEAWTIATRMARRDRNQQGTTRGAAGGRMRRHPQTGGLGGQESRGALACLVGPVHRRAGRPPLVPGSGRSARQSATREGAPRWKQGGDDRPNRD